MDSLLMLIPIAIGGFASFLFVWEGIRLFSRGWTSYEQKYVTGAAKTLESIYLTIPAQHLAYLSVAFFLAFGLVAYLLLGNVPIAVIAGLAGLPLPMILLKNSESLSIRPLSL